MNNLRLCLLALGTALLWQPRFVAAVEFASAQPVLGTVHRWVSFPGSLQPFQQVDLHARVAGYVKMVHVDRGDAVQAGQTLAEVEIPELEADVLKAKAELDAAETESKRLREARGRSPDLVLPQSVENAEARAIGARATLKRCQVLMDFAQIRAPFAGVVSVRSVDIGAYVAVGGTPLLHLVDPGRLRCQVAVTEFEAPLATPGKPVRILPDAMPGQLVEARLTRSSQYLDSATRTLLVESEVDNASGKLLAGMSVTVRIGVERHENTPVIPASALVMEKTNAFVFRHVSGKALKTPVKIGFNDGVLVEVPELKVEDVVLLVGSSPPPDGQTVNLKPAGK
jgi:RND family efflux transporter MFP subunit